MANMLMNDTRKLHHLGKVLTFQYSIYSQEYFDFWA